MIKQIHLNQCDSTQDILKEQSSEQHALEHILVSCETQQNGRGRGDNIWEAMPGTLCFSLSLAPHPVVSFTALEISLLVVKFFESKGKKLKLKWPNDIWTQEQKKCGGILVQGIHQRYLAGVGINLSSNDERFGGVYEQEFEVDKKLFAFEIAKFILAHRYQDVANLKQDWLALCGHLNQAVVIQEGSEEISGIFTGIGEFGEALIQTESTIKKVFNGSLRLT